ncbi:MAG: 2-oxoglutarate dehydrogenase E1 component, partial [Pseudomonadota bacterium]|nr:2-oxoglutarate dehydrogenase E1 component [Pseudomonadota bacterium]
VYYDLLEKRRELGLEQVAIVRVEQLYPYPEARLRNVLSQYPNAQMVKWCQEEPQNQGAWSFIAPLLYSTVHDVLPTVAVRYAGRVASAAPACGSPSLHARQQTALIADALGISTEQQGEA